MLEQPALDLDRITACVQAAYGLDVRHIRFLPLGADVHTAVYGIETADTSYFLKLRKSSFQPLSLSFPNWLKETGIKHIIAPLKTNTGHLHTSLRDFAVILYPYLEGRNGYEVALSVEQWRAFGEVASATPRLATAPTTSSTI